MDENKKEEIFSISVYADPIDAEAVLINVGSLVGSYYGLIENDNIEFRVEIKKSNCIELYLSILTLALTAPSAIESTINLIERLNKFLNKRKKKASKEHRKFRGKIKVDKKLGWRIDVSYEENKER